MASKVLRRLRRRRLSRRVLICLIGLCPIALTTAGLVWLLEALQTYSPAYYEPKDVERERYEMQRRTIETKSDYQHLPYWTLPQVACTTLRR